jgi:hypothetical protein
LASKAFLAGNLHDPRNHGFYMLSNKHRKGDINFCHWKMLKQVPEPWLKKPLCTSLTEEVHKK